jgi:hypothetical protein
MQLNKRLAATEKIEARALNYAWFFSGTKRFMVWCRAGLRGDFLSVYTDLFYEPQTLENL